MQIALRALVLVPRVLDALGEGDGIGQILRLDLREGRRSKACAEVLDDAVRADQELAHEVAVSRARVALIGELAERHDAMLGEAAAVHLARLDVERADGEHIGQIIFVDERAREPC